MQRQHPGSQGPRRYFVADAATVAFSSRSYFGSREAVSHGKSNAYQHGAETRRLLAASSQLTVVYFESDHDGAKTTKGFKGTVLESRIRTMKAASRERVPSCKEGIAVSLLDCPWTLVPHSLRKALRHTAMLDAESRRRNPSALSKCDLEDSRECLTRVAHVPVRSELDAPNTQGLCQWYPAQAKDDGRSHGSNLTVQVQGKHKGKFIDGLRIPALPRDLGPMTRVNFKRTLVSVQCEHFRLFMRTAQALLHTPVIVPAMAQFGFGLPPQLRTLECGLHDSQCLLALAGAVYGGPAHSVEA
eukprot:1120462-Amphidinium_carterae.4